MISFLKSRFDASYIVMVNNNRYSGIIDRLWTSTKDFRQRGTRYLTEDNRPCWLSTISWIPSTSSWQTFTKISHHRNLSVVYVCQNLFDKFKYHRTISLNSHYIVLLRNPRDTQPVANLARQIFCIRLACGNRGVSRSYVRTVSLLTFRSSSEHRRLSTSQNEHLSRGAVVLLY